MTDRFTISWYGCTTGLDAYECQTCGATWQFDPLPSFAVLSKCLNCADRFGGMETNESGGSGGGVVAEYKPDGIYFCEE